MDPVLTRAQIRAYDQHAIERCGVPGLVLMENAGRSATDHVVEVLRGAGGGVAVIVCGRGNNGGDGFVVGRHLRARGHQAEVWLVGPAERVGGDARSNLDAYVGLGGALHEVDPALAALTGSLARAGVVVDALFGTGLDRPLEGRHADIVGALNGCGRPIVSLDIPSGLDADAGTVLGVAVRARRTVTFGHRKIGLLLGEGPAHAGEVRVEGLGIDDTAVLAEVGAFARVIDESLVRTALGARAPDAHKYRAGSVLVVAGSRGKVGAASLAARAAMRAGAGLCTIATWPDAADALEAGVSELMVHRLEAGALGTSLEAALQKRKAVAIGPGLGLHDEARTLVDEVVLAWEGPVVVDADALTLLAGRLEALRQAPGPRILTPHAGELARLLDRTSAEIESDRFGAAARAADASGAVVVLKGQHTVVVEPGGRRLVCLRGNAALATAGSGDVLTGVLAALACAAEPTVAAAAGVWLHAVCAERWIARVGADRGLVAGDLIAELPAAMGAVQRVDAAR